MRIWIFIIGLIFIFFGLYPPFHFVTFGLGLILAITALLLKNKEKK